MGAGDGITMWCLTVKMLLNDFEPCGFGVAGTAWSLGLFS